MLSNPANRALLPWRCVLVVAVAIMILLLIRDSVVANPASGPLVVAAAPASRAAVTPTSRPPTTSTIRSGQDGGAEASDPVLPIVLAAILILALLGPTSGFPHSHRHWHSR
jgi:hypothetical protein